MPASTKGRRISSWLEERSCRRGADECGATHSWVTCGLVDGQHVQQSRCWVLDLKTGEAWADRFEELTRKTQDQLFVRPRPWFLGLAELLSRLAATASGWLCIHRGRSIGRKFRNSLSRSRISRR